MPVDIVPYVNGKADWELGTYDRAKAAQELAFHKMGAVLSQRYPPLVDTQGTREEKGWRSDGKPRSIKTGFISNGRYSD